MKTSDSIEAQEERKQASQQPSVRQKKPKYDASRIAAWRYKPGQSGNPGGRPKHDLAAEIAKAVFENNAEALYKAFSKALLKGNAYAFKELSDRAYGRLKETHQVAVSPYDDVPNEELAAKIKRLEVQLGYAKAEEPEMLPPASDDSDSKPN